MNLPLLYKNFSTVTFLIMLSLLKIVTLEFTMHILTILTYSLKLHVIEK